MIVAKMFKLDWFFWEKLICCVAKKIAPIQYGVKSSLDFIPQTTTGSKKYYIKSVLNLNIHSWISPDFQLWLSRYIWLIKYQKKTGLFQVLTQYVYQPLLYKGG